MNATIAAQERALLSAERAFYAPTAALQWSLSRLFLSGAWSLRLDRKSLQSPIPAVYASPPDLPLLRPQSHFGTGLGIFPYDDFERSVTPTPRTRGAFKP